VPQDDLNTVSRWKILSLVQPIASKCCRKCDFRSLTGQLSEERVRTDLGRDDFGGVFVVSVKAPLVAVLDGLDLYVASKGKSGAKIWLGS